MRAPPAWSLFVVAASALATSPVRAQAVDEYRHLGIQLRLVAAPAYLHATQELGPEDTQIEGFGALFGVALGAMVGERLALDMDLVLAPAAT